MTFAEFDRKALDEKLIAFRRDLHQYPESAWTEFRTTARILEELRKLGLEPVFGKEIHCPEKMFGKPSEDIMKACFERALSESTSAQMTEDIRKMEGGFTGCMVLIKGEKPGKRLGIRVDIDCNDVDETLAEDHVPNQLGFRSKHKTCMHACGHDGHASIGLGIASVLSACKDQLAGEVLLVFQPAEEGLRGAASLAATGLMDSCDYFVSSHIGIKNMPLGTACASSYGLLCSTKFDVIFTGKAAHAGLSPDDGKNAMAAACSAVLNMLAIPRHKDGASRINVGTFHSGTGRNVIPGEAVITVETRGVTTAINAFMEEQAMRICKAAADMWDCGCEIRFMGAAGGVDCDMDLAAQVAEVFRRNPELTNVIESIDFGGGEDVATIMSRVQEHGGKVTEMLFPMPLKAPHHNGAFDIDEKIISQCVKAYSDLAFELLK